MLDSRVRLAILNLTSNHYSLRTFMLLQRWGVSMMAIPAIGTRVEILVQGPAGETKHTGVILPGAAENHLSLIHI